jgi:hypothetical protein
MVRSFDALRTYLYERLPGPVEPENLLKVLIPAWDDLGGSEAESMHPGKLSRMETPEWCRPILRFSIERHGAASLGSIYAEVQVWEIDINEGTADVVCFGRRRIHPAAPRLNVRPLADEIAAIILARTTDPRVSWTKAGSAKVVLKDILPPAVKQTMAGRRRRFYDALDAKVAGEWIRRGSVYHLAPDAACCAGFAEELI